MTLLTVHQPSIFIPHSSPDKDFADWLADRLSAAGLPIWYDKWEIRVGDSIVKKINDGLKKSDYLAAVLSQASVTSRWVQEELSAATIMRINRRGSYILPLLIQDCNIPPLLSHIRYADFRYNRDRAFHELLETVTPNADIADELVQLNRQVRSIIRSLDPLSNSANEDLVFLDDSIQKIVHLRYLFEKRLRSEYADPDTQFFNKMEYLASLGIQIRSSAWSLVHSLRNRFFHASNRESALVKEKMKRIAGCGKELERIVSRICRIETKT